MKDEQKAFGTRLKTALRQAGLSESPAELIKLLARHGGVPVSPQAISGWLNGKSLPRQANMRALAKLLRVEPHQLQYGHPDGRKVRETKGAWVTSNVLDQHAIDKFLAMSATHRKLVRQLIDELAQVGKQK